MVYKLAVNILNKVQVHDGYAPAHNCAHDSAWHNNWAKMSGTNAMNHLAGRYYCIKDL